jgi:hypothetical protein
MTEKSVLLNPRFVKIYELLRGYGCSKNQALTISKQTFNAMPKECQAPSKAETEDLVKHRR